MSDSLKPKINMKQAVNTYLRAMIAWKRKENNIAKGDNTFLDKWESQLEEEAKEFIKE